MTDRDQPHHPTEDPLAHPDPGAYVGNKPERQAETIPGGVRPGDERIAANSSESGAPEPEDGPEPREAGQNR
jgi:hypothetical protein